MITSQSLRKNDCNDGVAAESDNNNFVKDRNFFFFFNKKRVPCNMPGTCSRAAVY